VFETVLVAIDGSPPAARTEAVALDVATRFDARLCAVAALSPDADPDRESALRAALSSVADRADRSVETVVRAGDPPVAIRNHAEAVGADLVVLGTRGRGGPHAFHLGSTAESVVGETPVPVMTVRGPGADGDGDGGADGPSDGGVPRDADADVDP